MAPPTWKVRSSAARSSQSRRAGQSRRGPSRLHHQRREESLESVKSSSSSSAEYDNEENGIMDTNELYLVAPDRIDQDIHPLREMAERVGREVELFAEKLDTWRPYLQVDREERRKAAYGLVHEYSQIAETNVQQLRREHAPRRGQEMKKEWRQAQKRFSNDTYPDAVADSDSNGDVHHRSRHGTTVEDLKNWQTELATWQLLEATLTYHFPDPKREHEEARATKNASDQVSDRFTADGETWNMFISGNDLARERLAVLKWLEATAEESGNDLEIIEEELEVSSGRGKALWTQGWIHTRMKIKAEKKLRMWDVPINSDLPEIKSSEGDKLLVTQLDLDARTRQDRILENADNWFEQSFWLMCWEMLRRGRSMNEIRDWCLSRNEYARALIMGAHTVDCNPQTPSKTVNARFLWRQSCQYAATYGALSSHERAVLALLCGWYTPMAQVCRSWDDHVFAQYTSTLLSQYEAYVMHHHVEDLPPKGLYSFDVAVRATLAGDPVTAARRDIAALQLKVDSYMDAKQPLKIIQASLIGHDFKDFVFKQGVALARKVGRGNVDIVTQLIPAVAARFLPEDEKIVSVTDDFNSLRVLAHTLLVFKDLGFDLGSGNRRVVMETVVVAYIAFLRLAGKLSLIPLYASRLSSDLSALSIARVLPDIINTGERMDYIKLITTYGLDIHGVLIAQYLFAKEYSEREKATKGFNTFKGLNLLERVKDKDTMWPGKRIRGHQAKQLEEYDEVMIQSLEWYMLADGNWRRTFWDLTDAAKRFLSAGRVDAAVELFKRLPTVAISKAKTPSILGKQMNIMDDHEGSDDEVQPPIRRATRAQQAHATGTTRPSLTPQKMKVFRDVLKKHARIYVELEQLVTALTALWAWRIAEDYQISQSLQLVGREAPQVQMPPLSVRESLDDLVSAMEPLLQDFLMHPSDGMSAEELKMIRDAYLPEMILAYNSALHCAAHLVTREHLLKSLDLATILAEKQTLIDCFTATGRVGELVDAFALTSRAVLTLNEKSSKSSKKRTRSGRTLGIWDITV